MTIEAKTKEKPMYVQTYYYQCLEFEVDWDELEIDYDDVEQMYVKSVSYTHLRAHET